MQKGIGYVGNLENGFNYSRYFCTGELESSTTETSDL